MVLWLILLWKNLSAEGELGRHMLTNMVDNRIIRLRFIWFPVVILTPLLLIVLSLSGYHYTALTFYDKFLWSALLVAGIIFIKDLLSRWLRLSERQLRYQDAITRRDLARERRRHIREKRLVDQEIVQQTDFQAIASRATQLLHTGILFSGIFGLWLIWSDLFPTLNIFDAVTLPLQATEIVDGIEKQVPVTLKDLLIAMLAGIVTYIAAKNLPAVFEILILQRLPVAASSRYAITTVSQYIIVIIGIIAVFSHIGLEWSSIQWLVAALGVGLGFGLQEIVANFISGIIILFEKPVRVGDLVTIGDATGNVTQIRIRATTIRNWEKQELLVPNKELITGRVLNWSLSDQLNRLTIKVGIAYGSNVSKAISLIADAAREHPRILNEPESVITFEQFGDNSLNLTLRCFLDKLEFRLPTISELHLAINEKFNTAGIVIAYPQRDIHFDSSSPIKVHVVEKDKSNND
jgi:potassium efflux system protein